MAGRPRLPVAGRLKNGREPRTLCAATNLSPSELIALDRAAARAGETRSGFIRTSVRDRMRSLNYPVDNSDFRE
jgi:hypothetical protein